MCRPRSRNSWRSDSGSSGIDSGRPWATSNIRRYAPLIRSLSAPISERCGRRARLAGTSATIADRGKRRCPPGVVKLATWPRSAQRRSVPWLMPRTRLASPRPSQASWSAPGS